MRTSLPLILVAVVMLSAAANGQPQPVKGKTPPRAAAPRVVPAPAHVDVDPKQQQQQQESRDIAGPVVSTFSSRGVCGIYGYLDGKVTDRTIDGDTGIFQVTVYAVNRGFAVPSPSPFTSVCGDPGRLVGLNERFSFEVKAQFHRDSRGNWHLERVLPQ